MVSITSASTFTIGRSCWSTPESAFERAKHLGGAGSGLVSLARHCLDDEAAVAIQPTFSGKTKLEASGNSFQASRCQSGRLLVYRFNKTYTYYSAPSASNFFHR